ncbi:MAG: N5-glutamine S-adenosyl-L-methionine-dependent methyltransferase [Mycoplasmataceae bacterium RV_VA103A]|nr:MAG: N5-glutamine S-adenosyl-L-methionine-dependent methyltransferase [Mycoplasmataceae bacterium RV_VA103A]
MLYSYQDCWNYALSLRENVDLAEVKNDIIALCQTVPEKFWADFSHKSMSTSEYLQICHNLSRHLQGNYPVPYLTNQASFYGLDFLVEKGVFIPQSDTEILVKKTLEWVNKCWKSEKKLKFLDIGTGCGNIVISLAKNRPADDFLAVDINEQALKVAKINAARQEAKNIRFIKSDLFSNIDKKEKFNIIMANPPYVGESEYQNLVPAVKEQPRKALIAANEGYFFYQKIFRQARHFLAKKFLLMVEIGPRQAENVIKLIIEHLARVQISIFPDYSGHPRVIMIISK